jgi:hypothetical protein
VSQYEYVVSLIRLQSQLEELIRKLDELVKALSRPVPTPTPTAPQIIIPQVTVETALNNRYRVFTLDLSTARSNEPLGLADQGIVARCVTVVRCDSTAYWRRNSERNDLEELSPGYTVENFEIQELYITNPVGRGSLVIVVEWRE